MAELPEDKKISLTTDYKDNTINMEFMPLISTA